MSGVDMAITMDTTGAIIAMTGTIGDGIEILTATGVSHSRRDRDWEETNWRKITVTR
jgi:hypothetical protein